LVARKWEQLKDHLADWTGTEKGEKGGEKSSRSKKGSDKSSEERSKSLVGGKKSEPNDLVSEMKRASPMSARAGGGGRGGEGEGEDLSPTRSPPMDARSGEFRGVSDQEEGESPLSSRDKGKEPEGESPLARARRDPTKSKSKESSDLGEEGERPLARARRSPARDPNKSRSKESADWEGDRTPSRRRNPNQSKSKGVSDWEVDPLSRVRINSNPNQSKSKGASDWEEEGEKPWRQKRSLPSKTSGEHWMKISDNFKGKEAEKEEEEGEGSSIELKEKVL
jgi:hypothetical protein